MLGPFPKGISAEWQIAGDKHLLVKPLDSKNVSFALIAPLIVRTESYALMVEELSPTLSKPYGNMK